MTTSLSNRQFVEQLKDNIPCLYKQWGGLPDDTGYPIDYQGITPKSEALLLELDRFSERQVLDIGCNSGLYSYVAGKYAKSVIGCDLEKVLIDRAECARPFFDSYYDTNKVSFYRGNFLERISDRIDGVIAACVLYHIGDANLKALMTFLTRRKPLVVLQVRPRRYEAFLQNPDWGAVSNTMLFNGVFRIEDNIDFLRACGYNTVLVVGLNTTSFFGETFPVLIATD